jgi:hypothetical protein
MARAQRTRHSLPRNLYKIARIETKSGMSRRYSLRSTAARQEKRVVMQSSFRHRNSFAQQLCVAFSLLLLFMAPKSLAQTSAVAATQSMGWNSWNHFAGKIDDATVRAQADAMVSSGMRDAGYVYINIDHTWQGERDARGIIHANSRFPDMKALAEKGRSVARP